MSRDFLEVSSDLLRKVCNPDDLGFETTNEVAPLEGTIGQERAVSALEFGLGIGATGFNVFVSGLTGTGRNTTLKAYLERAARDKPVPPDWCYVYNFLDPSRPMAISLPCGMTQELVRDMSELIETCKREIPRAFEGESYQGRVTEAVQDIESQKQSIGEELEAEARKEGFALNLTPAGILPIPVKDDQPIGREEYAKLEEEERNLLREKGERLQHLIALRLTDMRRLDKEAVQRARGVTKEVARFTVDPLIRELKEKYSRHAKVIGYLEGVEQDIVENVDMFKAKEEPSQPSTLNMLPAPADVDPFIRYRVNPLVDNTACEEAPIVFEYSPTYYNLFGRIDYHPRLAAMVTDLTMIKPGAIHKANGGYLVLQARDLLSSPLAWDTLKRALRSRQVQIENIGEQYSPFPTITLRPEPIPIDTKIVMVGNPQLFQMLQIYDEDFRKYFKVKADFDLSMERTPENMLKYASFVERQCREGGLKPFHKSAVAQVIDYSSQLVEHQDKLTTRFMDVVDIIVEANYWAGQDGASSFVLDKHVKKAIDQRIYRSNLTEEKLQEFIEDRIIHIDTKGETSGQVNGLSVISLGDYAFGKPSRITARVSLGRGQVVNVERETQLSGRIHNKGFLILTGYVNGKYGQDRPLSLAASIGFEQTYSEIDGDSASSTELYVLLSSLSGLPISQGIAVTGSVNQTGEVQAIGGATAKIEGFFDVCKAQGLTGSQGVMIPRDNLKNLVLKEEVVKAVKDGKFHIWAVSTIDEGIEILTGVPAGTQKDDGTYEKGTVHYLVERRLKELSRKAREFGTRRGRKEQPEKESEE
ncbi:MAG: AAA family ATPase [Chloroflexi bacterium]|nr:AAA family ATPase [Chloroflexota bacterium]